jgi:hypothetical protein
MPNTILKKKSQLEWLALLVLMLFVSAITKKITRRKN